MASKPFTLAIEVIHVQGHCPLYRVGDRFDIRKGFQLITDRPLCMHALQALNPYYIPLSRGIQAHELGLAGPQGGAYVQCMDAQRFTGGGTVTFRISPQFSGNGHG